MYGTLVRILSVSTSEVNPRSDTPQVVQTDPSAPFSSKNNAFNAKKCIGHDANYKKSITFAS